MRTNARIRLDAEQFLALVKGGEVVVEGHDAWHDLSSGAPAEQPYTVRIILADIGFERMINLISQAALERARGR